MTRASNLDKSILKPSLVQNGYKGGNIRLYSFDYIDPIWYPPPIQLSIHGNANFTFV
jgi:hypothetical protein